MYDKEKADYNNVKLFGILRGDSVSYKSGYIKPIRKAFDFVERYFQEMFIDCNRKFNSTCIESLTGAKLLAELESSSKFISSDEDRPLTDFCFFEPNSPKAKELHPYLISAFNGLYKLQRSTMTYSKEVKERSLTILIPTTGDRWWSLLEYFNDSNQTNGLYERFLYWNIGKRNFVHEASLVNNELPSLEHLYITRMLIGSRIYEYDDETSTYLRPILSDMRSNRVSCQGLLNVPQNKRAEACQRRGADLIERIAMVFQNIFDTLKVLQPIQSIQFDRIQRNTLDEIKNNINNIFYSNDTHTEVNNDPVYPDGIDLKDLAEVQITSVKKGPLQSMKIGISAAKSAVRFFKKVLLPQSIQLFSTDMVDIKKNIVNELKIIQHPINCFSISDLTYNSIFHNYKRDNIDVKEVLLNLEKKRLLKCGKFLKVGSRSIDSWIKILPEPTNDEEIRSLRNELNSNYQLELEKYIELYESGIDHKSSLTETSERILLTQRLWIEQLRWKLNSPTIQQNISEFTTDVLAPEMPQVEDETSFSNVFQDIINSFTHNPIDLQTTCLAVNESIGMVQQMNFSPIIERCNEILMDNNENILHDNGFLEDIIQDCLSDLTSQVANLVKINDATMIDSTQNKNKNFIASSSETSTKFMELNDFLISDNMKILCRRILLTDSVVLSSTKLNKTCKTNMVDVHKACNLLIDHGLLSIENKMLANKFTYHESYIKTIPQNKSYLVDFSLTLAKFGIFDIQTYYETLKTIDTKNGTYITSYGMSILKQKPYSDFGIVINENNVMEPVKERCRKFVDCSRAIEPVDNSKDVMEADKTINSEHDLENSISNSKRRRELTGKGKQYQEQRMKKKKKKDNH
ncbi:unnamed protein product [Rotaria magnacalcarata]|uniref:Uncharacterized protein n=1 Tax=Rotaria magnacalcarata TaxID=392030 RepID=A0A816WVS1_9BILA|nr:unnamed protein product [Rotaria magnacalcarata]